MESVQLYFDLIKAGLKRFAEYRSSFIAGFFGLIMINGSSILDLGHVEKLSYTK